MNCNVKTTTKHKQQSNTVCEGVDGWMDEINQQRNFLFFFSKIIVSEHVGDLF